MEKKKYLPKSCNPAQIIERHKWIVMQFDGIRVKNGMIYCLFNIS